MTALLTGCRTEEPQLTIQEELPTTSVAHLSSHDFFYPTGIFKSGDKVALLASSSAYNAIAFDLQSGEEQRFFQRLRPNNDRMTSLMSFNSTDGRTLTALDFRHGRLIETLLPSTVSRSAAPVEENIIQLPEGQQHLIAAKGSSFVIATGLYDEGRYLYYDLNTHAASYHLDYPGHRDYPRLSTRTKAILYASNILRVRPDEKAFVCADMYSGLIDFCRIVGSSVERVSLVRLHHPEVAIDEEPDINVAYYRSNRLGFADVAVSQECVYALYSGRAFEDFGNDASLGDILLVYDWEGNLLRSCLLDAPVAHITYDPAENALYGLVTGMEDELIRLNL